MDRNFLKQFDLSDDVIKSIIDEHHSNMNGVKEQLNEKKEEVKELKNDKNELSRQLKDVEDKEDVINSLRSKYDDLKEKVTEYENKLNVYDLDKEIMKNVSDAYDIDDVLNYIDRSSFEYDDDGNITNFDDVLNKVREKKPHYFSSEQSEQKNSDQDFEKEQHEERKESRKINYATGKETGAGSTGKTDYEAIGTKWANLLNGKK